MHLKKIKFSTTQNKEFTKTVRRRVNLYFKLNKINKGANFQMKLKTVILLLLYISPLILICTGQITSILLNILLYFISGLGIAGIGMGIMHDANHASYSNNASVNKLLSITLDFMGCSSAMWKFQHNVLHHTYTNIHGHDEDINSPTGLLRFCPHKPKNKIHKFQHWYVWFFYSILTLYWFSVKDFRKAKDYYKKGLITSKKELNKYYLLFIPIKLLYLSYALIIPMYMASFSPLWILLGFVISHLTAGLLLSVIFQLAHVVPNMEFPQSNEKDEIDSAWFIHQLETTSNFAPKSNVSS